MVLLPVAIGLAVLALLAILRRERHQHESGIPAERPLFVTLVLVLLAFLGLVYLTLYMVSSLTT
jgi:hypothetical protein